MLHWIAFIVIGLGVGALLAWALQKKAAQPIVVLVGGLVGGVVGGKILQAALHGNAGKYLSLLGALVLAGILAWLARRLGTQKA